MRILKVSLCNLNSLKGEHTVDFAEGPLATSGLYAITGPTGAGKTTLLDAITLALFGKAARYGNERSPQDIMTRGAGESWAEVRFQTSKGVFTARWGRNRAHGKADGEVQPASRKIRAVTGKIVTEQVRDADDKMAELTGLDYDRFMRSVMLAQGQFAKFLASKPNERAELLESMTGTELYSRLGILAFEEAKRREAGILAREAEAAGIPVLDAETRAQLTAEAAQARKDHAALKAEQQKAAPLIGKITTLREALLKIDRRKEEVDQAAEALEDMADDLEALARHRKTEPFADLLAVHRAAEAALTKSRAEHGKAVAERAEAAEELGLALAEHRQSVEAARDEARQAVADRDDEHKQAVQDHADAKEWLEDNRHLEKLGASLTKLSAAGQARDGAVDTLDRATAAWRRLPHKAFPKAHKAFPAQVEEVDAKRLVSAIEACAEELRASVAAAAARLPDLRKVVEVTQARLDDARAVQRYAADRARLKEGDECPLCGSKHHDIRHKGPVVSVEAIQRDLDKAKQEVDVARDLERQGAQDLKDLAKAGKELLAAQAGYVAAHDAFNKLCVANGLDPDDGFDVEELEGEVDEYREAKSGLKDKLAAIAQAERDLADARKELTRLQGALDKFKAPPAGVRLGKAGKRVKPLAEAEKAADKAEKRFRDAEAAALASNKPLDQAGKAMDAARRQLEAKLGKSDFESVDDLLDAKLEDSAVKRITREKDAADKRLDLAKANLKAAEESVADLRRQKVPEGEAAEALLERDTELREKADEALARGERAKGDLRADDEARERKARLEREMEDEKASIEVWRRLRALIGSADGASFSKFAQSITLDILMGHANRHMSRLNARYVLLRDPSPSAELGLIVEDRHQGGHRRPMASLSGGESFLASLALALGLSDLAGKSVRIESLFIDEGFGTLDPETLEVALDALESLRQGNRSVGIISHVSLLKERITTQIVVHKSANGHSRLEIKA